MGKMMPSKIIRHQIMERMKIAFER